jgi:sulfoxide reductase heme-binding subunit YedZ
MLPWILGRGLGLAAYLSLTALTVVGLWLRHPWRTRVTVPRPEALLRAHAALAAATLLVLAGHIVALVLDPWAGVHWVGAAVPGRSGYRPFAVALGTVSVYLAVIVAGTAALAGRIVRRAWLPVHRVALAVFATAWLHGVLAGSDAGRLTVMYVATGAIVGVVAATRRVATAPAPLLAGERT